MVSFTCSVCQDVVKKPKVAGHGNMCRGASFACVDCMEVFDIHTVKGHTSCVTEVEKYQGKWRRNTSGGFQPQQQQNQKLNGHQKSANDSDDENHYGNGKSDSKGYINGNNAGRNGADKKMRRPAMQLSSDSDDDDDSWVKQKKKTSNKAGEAEKTTQSTDASSSLSSSSVVAAKAVSNVLITAATVYEAEGAEVRRGKRHRLEPLVLPRSVCSTEASDCVVPSFVLGSDDEVTKVVRWVLEDAAPATLNMKELARKLVECYEARLARKLRCVVESLIRRGKLRLEEGVVMMRDEEAG
ncbi:Cell growth-regulating nucleolar protein, putative [Trypanosoma equiperdum]|uniref:Zinc finger C2H2 LYAR-type domain-containing protein n=2 Tax=Trypanozoon TaxID=39700 RepID=Q57WD3_TRYB2|nr:hypothetical protein, conserved [Trypanosoma brucei brucei TREU927]AAX70100.1 hypothetical protein, conserved [Trypanosoma brucei]AAZ10430.1 hypothetical protein, conserved [Trypanosoma brucei brucei TREU927]SCU66092.1 Cell growth-regulating nucleolar protein, putative [Trypanosoma equiperdum]